MTFLTHHGDGPSFRYAGQPVHILAGHEDRPAGFAAMEITIPAHFAGPIPHAHDEFDEAIYVLRGRLLVAGDDDPQEAAAGSMFAAPRGQPHGFSNPHDADALVLGIWAPAAPAIAFMRDIGAALTPDTPPDPGHMREIYARHACRLLPCPPADDRRGTGAPARDRAKPKETPAARHSGFASSSGCWRQHGGGKQGLGRLAVAPMSSVAPGRRECVSNSRPGGSAAGPKCFQPQDRWRP